MLVLASRSPARIRLLEAVGLAFEAATHLVNETDYVALPPATKAKALAEAKALSLVETHPGATIIGSDQVLQFGQAVFSKPNSMAQVRHQLQRLRGQSHQLHTAVACASQGKIGFSLMKTVTLHMRPFSDAFLDDYLSKEGEELFGCAGGYRIEGLGLQLFTDVPDDIFSVQGMPLLPLLAHLREMGIMPT